jgi:hypothetical protein
MTGYDITARRAAGAAALLVGAALALTGCKSSTSAAGTSSPAADASSTAPASTSPAASASGSAAAQVTPLFPVGVNNTWVYATKLAGKPGNDVTNKMIAVDQVPGGQQVTMSVGTGTSAASTTVTYLFHPDGSITVPITQFGNGTVKLTSGSVTWPTQAQLATGQAVASTLQFTTTLGSKVTHQTAHVTVEGAGLQTVTVPAGTYQAQLINEKFSESVGGLPVSFTLQTWVATGVGPVKTAVGSTSVTGNVPTTVEELKSFTKGQ